MAIWPLKEGECTRRNALSPNACCLAVMAASIGRVHVESWLGAYSCCRTLTS